MKKNTKIAIAVIVVILGLVLVIQNNSTKTTDGIVKEEGNKVYEIKTGTEYNENLEIENNANEFKAGEQLYFTVGNRDKAKEDIGLNIIILDEDEQEIENIEFKIEKGNVTFRPIYPIEFDNAGVYILSVESDEEVLYTKPIEVK